MRMEKKYQEKNKEITNAPQLTTKLRRVRSANDEERCTEPSVAGILLWGLDRKY